MTDIRVLSTNKLIPPKPLPYVSRKALKRCKNGLSPITDCNLCGGKVSIVTHEQVYSGRSYGDWPYCYQCDSCKAYVGIHKDTDLPLGTLANADMRKARKDAKPYFMMLSESRFPDRNAAYRWLAEKMGINKSECHFAMFSVEQCELAKSICIKEILCN